MAILDPFGEVRGPARIYRTQYNPLLDIAVGTSAQTRQIKSIAAAIIVPEQGTGAHFSESAETLLAGTIEAVMQNEAQDRQTLPFVRQKLLAGFEALTDYLSQKMLPEGLAAEALGVLTDVLGTDEAGSFRTTLSRNLKWLSDPDMRAHLQPSTFSLRELVQSGGSLYIVIKPDLIDDNKGWLRLLVRLALSAKIDLGDKQQGPQTLFMLDEFAALGRVKEIEKSAGYMAGYGVKLLPIIQNVGQVKDLYDRNWETFLGNAGAIIAWGLNDDESEKYIADRCGRVLISETSTSTNSGQSGALGFGNMSSGKSASTALHERPVLYPNQVHALGARETMRAFVIPASGKPFMVQRVPYMSLDGRQLFDGPADIARWEARFGEGG